ncbi:MAG: FAD-binding protein [Acidimicrobiales bacterium]
MDERAEKFDIVVVGCGTAGLAAAASAAGTETDRPLRIAVLERAVREERGGNSSWTGAYFRLEDVYTPADGFAEDIADFCRDRVPTDYVTALVDRLPETMEWLQEFGARFRAMPTIFITKSRPRVLPVGGGERLVHVLAEACENSGVEILYETTAIKLRLGDRGDIEGLLVNDPNGQRVIATNTVIIASGGFEGNPEMMTQYMGPTASELRTIAPGGMFNKGEGIRMALDVGAKATGEWGQFHAEPIDPRSSQPEAVVMIYAYGLLVNRQGVRFLDEGSGTVDETYEATARTVWRDQGNLAYTVCDNSVRGLPNFDHAVMTDRPAIIADTLEELADAMGVPRDAFMATVEEFNAATRPGTFDCTVPDGLATEGLDINKSNWARPLVEAPFLAYPLSCSIVFTFGGIGTDLEGRAITADDRPIPGLFAAGECTGLYHFKYPGATSVMRGLVFGKRAGLTAAAYAAGLPSMVTKQ